MLTLAARGTVLCAISVVEGSMQPAPTASSIKVAPAPPVAQRDQPAERSDSEAAVPQRKDAGHVDAERPGAPVRMLYLVE